MYWSVCVSTSVCLILPGRLAGLQRWRCCTRWGRRSTGRRSTGRDTWSPDVGPMSTCWDGLPEPGQAEDRRMDGGVRTQQLFWNVSYLKLLNTHGEKHGCQQEPNREDQTFTVQFNLKQDKITVNQFKQDNCVQWRSSQRQKEKPNGWHVQPRAAVKIQPEPLTSEP